VKVALLAPRAIDNEAGVNVFVPVEELASVTVLVASAVFAFPFASCRCTVIAVEATPAATVTAVLVITSLLAAAGLIVAMVAVPVLADPVTMKVLPLPATVGVTLTPLNTPDVKLADVPVIPAVPLYATVETKLVTVLLFTSCAVSVMPVMAVPAVCGDEIVEMAK
jgi:hypothetical protein